MSRLKESYPWYELHQKYIKGERDGVCAKLSRADLRWASLSEASLSWADLSGADLRWAKLSWADLRGADLRWAKLSVADLSMANLSGANFSRANLCGADISRANLCGANFSRANLSGAKTFHGEILTHAAIYAANHGECGRQLLAIRHVDPDSPDLFWCGCFHGNESELREYVENGQRKYRHSRTVALNCVLDLLDLGGGR